MPLSVGIPRFLLWKHRVTSPGFIHCSVTTAEATAAPTAAGFSASPRPRRGGANSAGKPAVPRWLAQNRGGPGGLHTSCGCVRKPNPKMGSLMKETSPKRVPGHGIASAQIRNGPPVPCWVQRKSVQAHHSEGGITTPTDNVLVDGNPHVNDC